MQAWLIQESRSESVFRHQIPKRRQPTIIQLGVLQCRDFGSVCNICGHKSFRDIRSPDIQTMPRSWFANNSGVTVDQVPVCVVFQYKTGSIKPKLLSEREDASADELRHTSTRRLDYRTDADPLPNCSSSHDLPATDVRCFGSLCHGLRSLRGVCGHLLRGTRDHTRRTRPTDMLKPNILIVESINTLTWWSVYSSPKSIWQKLVSSLPVCGSNTESVILKLKVSRYHCLVSSNRALDTMNP